MSALLPQAPAEISCRWSNGTGNTSIVHFRHPDADVNGIGVVIAFFLLAAFPLITTTVSYARGVPPEELFNDYDRKFFKIKLQPSGQWATNSRENFLALSMQQLVSGIAILTSGFATISEAVVFDFHATVYQGFMCTAGHSFTSMLLLDYFRSSVLHKSLHVVSLVTLLGLLCAAIFPTTHWGWTDSVLIPNACLGPSDCVTLQMPVKTIWNSTSHTKGGGISPQGAFTYVILIIHGISQIALVLRWRGRFFRTFLGLPRTWLHRAVNRISVRVIPGNKRLQCTMLRPALTGTSCFEVAISDLIGSFGFRLWISYVTFAWGTFQLFIPRLVVLPACVRDAVDQWNFGQIVALILLVTPTCVVIRLCFASHTHSGQDHQPQTNIQPLAVPQSNEIQASGSPELYSSAYFKTILVLLTFIVIASPIGFVASTTVAYIGPGEPVLWWTVDWHLWPIVIATVIAFGLVYMFAVVGAYFSNGVYSEF